MSLINVLSEETIDKIAAGEVVERPSSVVKELVENAIDAGATAVTIEIKDGGTSFIRVTDNGSGILKEDIKTAFLRHATSKIKDAHDLESIASLGFRGEALSSIAAVAQVELMTKTLDCVTGYRYVIEGAKEVELSEVGVPTGTTIIVRNLFFNTPVRRKFLKSATTEASYVADVCEHLALSKPDVSIKFVSGGQVKFHTSGSGDLSELIYRIYGKDIASQIIPIEHNSGNMSISGYLGKPILNRSTRNYENFFINGRYIKSKLLSTAAEDGYKEYLMQHKFPFFIINLEIDTSSVDVNVHPTKMDVRFSDNIAVSDFISSAVSSTLRVREMIPDALFESSSDEDKSIINTPEPFEVNRSEELSAEAVEVIVSNTPIRRDITDKNDDMNKADISSLRKIIGEAVTGMSEVRTGVGNVIKASNAVIVEKPVQMDLFEEQLLHKDAIAEYKIVGQLFDTFWLFEYKDKLLIMDQHAAHEKVKFESLIRQLEAKSIASQSVNPPIVITLSSAEAGIFNQYKDTFADFGFEIEEFGGNEICLRAIPLDLYGRDPKELFLDILDEIEEGHIGSVPDVVRDKIASMACKAAVKGNMRMTDKEVLSLLDELLKLDNPYNCPHGRPTIITMTKYEIDKKFKRIV